jgi:hypothetical protein
MSAIGASRKERLPPVKSGFGLKADSDDEAVTSYPNNRRHPIGIVGRQNGKVARQVTRDPKEASNSLLAAGEAVEVARARQESGSRLRRQLLSASENDRREDRERAPDRDAQRAPVHSSSCGALLRLCEAICDLCRFYVHANIRLAFAGAIAP